MKFDYSIIVFILFNLVVVLVREIKSYEFSCDVQNVGSDQNKTVDVGA